MIEDLEIESFRGLGRIALTRLARVNVIVGPNASGKTALLEALTLGCRASPQTALTMWQGRAQSQFVPMGTAGFQAVWAGLFPGLDFSRDIVIRYRDSNLGRRSLRIALAPSPPMIASGAGAAPIPPLPTGGMEPRKVTFERMAGSVGATEQVSSYIGRQGELVVENADPIGPAAALFPAFVPPNEHENIAWLSQLSVAKRESEVLKVLRQEYPFIESLDVLSPYGIQGIFVSQSGMPNKLPIGLVSSGINKILTLILVSLLYEGGIILVDEIENGIFHERYESVWRLLRRLAAERKNQIFITSHSLECLNAALPEVRCAPDDFSLIRMERGRSGIVARRFGGREFEAALQQGVDPRGNDRRLVRGEAGAV
jgi:hypothetical protein